MKSCDQILGWYVGIISALYWILKSSWHFSLDSLCALTAGNLPVRGTHYLRGSFHYGITHFVIKVVISYSVPFSTKHCWTLDTGTELIQNLKVGPRVGIQGCFGCLPFVLLLLFVPPPSAKRTSIESAYVLVFIWYVPINLELST